MLHTFHSVLSGSEAFTIGSSPWDESCKRRRKAAATAVNRPSVASYVAFIDLESLVSIKELASQIGGNKSQVDLNPYALFQRLALNLSLTLGYGFRIDGNSEDSLLREIVTVERGISTLRSTSNNWQDFIPMLRMLPKGNDRAADLRERRDKYLEFLLKRLKDHIVKGTDKPCITGNILKDPEYELTHSKIEPSTKIKFPNIHDSNQVLSGNQVDLSDHDSWRPRYDPSMHSARHCDSLWTTRARTAEETAE